MSRKQQSTDAEVERRIGEVFNLLVAGVRRREVLQFAASQGWDLKDRQVDNYIAAATEQIRNAASVDKAMELGRAIRRLHHLYQASQRIQDHKTSLAVARELTALLGLAAPSRMDLELTVGGFDEWVESIQAMLESGEREQLENDET